MKKNVLNTDLTGKVCVVTGAGGAICGMFAEALAAAGGKVAVLDLNETAAQAVADKITAEGGVAKAYAGAKAAIVNFTEWLATYCAKSGIRVNAIAPGFFVGNQNRGLLFNDDGTPTARTAKILAGTPMGRFGELEELVGAVLFLLNNDAAGFITGVCIPIDGGYAAYSGV